MSEKIRVRLAPSPTGYMHVGNARTALINYMFALRHKGAMILRLDDTDRERSKIVFEDDIISSLKWLGIKWDEGPGVGGDYGPYRQSERLEIYREYSRKLIEKDLVYPCYCSEEELEVQRRMQLKAGKMPRYSGKCRQLTDAQKKKLESEGKRPALRFRVNTRQVSFRDMMLGNVNFSGSVLGDFIIVRSDGFAAYNFATVVDEILLKISHVIRGQDHISNTPRQLLIYEALNETPPVFGHHALLLGKDRSKLSKRHGVTAVSEFRRRGYLAEAMVNYLLLMGWSPPGEREIFHLEEMVEHYRLEDLGKSGAIFDFDKLKWLNGHHMRNKPAPELAAELFYFAEESGFDVKSRGMEWFTGVTETIKNNLELLTDVDKQLPIFFEERFQLSAEVKDFLESQSARNVIGAFHAALSNEPEIDGKNLVSIFKSVGKETKTKGQNLYMPIRAALTGFMEGPELDKVILILGKEACVSRLEKMGFANPL